MATRLVCWVWSDGGPTHVTGLFANLGHLFAHLMMLLYPTVVLALEQEFDTGYGELIALLAVGNLLFGLGAVPAGWLGDRWGVGGMMVVFFVGTGAAAILTGLMESPLGIGFGLSLIGLFASIYHPVGIAWVVRSTTKRGRALGVNGIFGSIGAAAAGVTAGVLTEAISWRAAFIVPGAVCAGIGLVLLACQRWGVALAQPVATSMPEPPLKSESVGSGGSRQTRTLMLLAISMLGTGLMYQSMSAAMPKLFTARLAALTGGTTAAVGGLVSLVYLLAAAAQLLGGYLADRYPPRRLYLTAYAVLVPLFLLAVGAMGGPLLLLVVVAVFVNTTVIPVENMLLADNAPRGWHGTVFGGKFVLSLGGGALAVPVVALLHEATGGFGSLFVVWSALAATIAVVVLLLPRHRAANAATDRAAGAR